MEHIYVLFICESHNGYLSLTCAHSYYSTSEAAIKAKEFYNNFGNNPNLVYQVIEYPVYKLKDL